MARPALTISPLPMTPSRKTLRVLSTTAPRMAARPTIIPNRLTASGLLDSKPRAAPKMVAGNKTVRLLKPVLRMLRPIRPAVLIGNSRLASNSAAARFTCPPATRR
jgi:hypothetical protein